MTDTAENATPAAEHTEAPSEPQKQPEAKPPVADKRALRWGVGVLAAVLVVAVAAGVALHGSSGGSHATNAKTGAPASGGTATGVYTAPAGSSATSAAATSTPDATASGSAAGSGSKSAAASTAKTTGDAVLTKHEQRTIAQKYDALRDAMDATYSAVNFSSRGDALTSEQWRAMERSLQQTHDTAAELRKAAQAAGGDAAHRRTLVAALTDLEKASAELATIAGKHGDVWSARYSTGLVDCWEAVPSAYGYYVRG